MVYSGRLKPPSYIRHNLFHRGEPSWWEQEKEELQRPKFKPYDLGSCRKLTYPKSGTKLSFLTRFWGYVKYLHQAASQDHISPSTERLGMDLDGWENAFINCKRETTLSATNF